MIEFQNIHLYLDGKQIIRNLSLEIKQGEKVVISGKSGSGKTSLLSLVLGFLEPSKGKVFFNGRTVNEKSVWKIRKQVAYIDQDVSLGNGKIVDLLDFVSKLKTNAKVSYAKEHVKDLLTYFELDPEITDKNIEDLSGGERQRLAIVVSTLLQRNVFLLDEVTAALDKHLKEKVTNYFLTQKDWTCLVISHDATWQENPLTKIFNLDEKKWEH